MRYILYGTTKKSTVIKEIKDRKRRDPEIDARHNRKQLIKKIVRLVNANFSDKDIWITVGYKGSEEPTSLNQAKKDVVNYIRRLQRYCKKMNYPQLKYLYVTEQGAKSGRYHHHIVLSFPDRDIAELKWTKGKYSQARRLKPDDFGLEGLARYISKTAHGEDRHSDDENSKPKNYGYSLNLYKPWQHAIIADSKMTRARATKLAKYEVNPMNYFQGVYKGYQFKDMQVNYSDYVSGCYLYIRMRRNE